MSVTDIAVPMMVKAFVLNPVEAARLPLAPIVQPDYTRLRLDPDAIDNDVLDHVDMSRRFNGDRTVNPLTNAPRSNRYGVYVHWMLPHFYRMGMAASTAAANTPAKHASRLQQQGFATIPPLGSNDDLDYSAPSYRSVPNRWLVVRFVNRVRYETPERLGDLIPLDPKVPQYQAFIVEGDRVRDGAKSAQDSVSATDWEVECSPYLDLAAQDIQSRTGVSIGFKTLLEQWQGEDGRVPTPAPGSIPRRVQRITIGDTSNFLFADYQPHDSNVFSIFDDLMIHPTDGSPPYRLPDLTLSYFVYGWHSNPSDDPLLIATKSPDAKSMTNAARLQASGFTVNPKFDTGGVLLTSSPLSIKCHGSINEVHWSMNTPVTKAPCLDAINLFAKSSPVAVGSTTLDALLALIQAHQHDNNDADPAPLSNFVSVARDIIKLQTFLLQDDDTVDAQLQAADLLYEQNFKKVASGNVWHFSGKTNTEGQKVAGAVTQPVQNLAAEGAAPTPPSQAQQDILKELNADQTLLDVALRQAKQMQWLLFAEWWKYVSDDDRISTQAGRRSIVSAIVKDLMRLQDLITRLQASVTTLSASIPCEMARASSFYKQADPTLLIGGIDPGWPSDWLDSVPIRLPACLVPTPFNCVVPPDLPMARINIPPSLLDPSNSHVLDSLMPLFAEFAYLFPRNTSDRNPTTLAQYKDSIPFYCEGQRDCWDNTQPFSPLFIEWEAQYFHIPFDAWSLQKVDGKLQYGIAEGISVEDVTGDVRIISGRSLLLPQAPFSLRVLVMQLFKHTPSDTLTQLGFDKQHQDDLCDKLRAELPFISCPLSGFLDHLLTKSHGIHVKPNNRLPRQKPVPEAGAVAIGGDINLTDKLFQFMGSETTATPYGALVDLPDLGGQPSPFKPVVHGQFRFRKLNIIDRFGQAVAAIDSSAGRNFIRPCTSQYLSCQPLQQGTDSVANTVVLEASDDNEFVQLPPTINHDARINCCFVVRDDPEDPWRPCSEWENPIWGWIVINYPDTSLQLFYPDGSFYRELTPGRDKTSLKSQWIPFLPPTKNSGTHPQLDRLVAMLGSKQNLQDFFSMISDAQNNAPHTPGAYAECLPAITGKPLALVNAGWSLELASPPMTNQSSVSTTPPSPDLLEYAFPMQFGDADRAYDGLVGYWDGGLGERAELELDTIFTYYPAPVPSDASSPSTSRPKPLTNDITFANYPRLPPFFVSPLDADQGPNLASTKYTKLWTDNLRILGLLMDPYLAVHSYSGILPMATLQLPAWPMDAAMKKITAFFKTGPFLLTNDVPSTYDSQFAIPDGVNLKDFPTRPTPTIPIAISGTASEWHYLHPYTAIDTQKTTSVMYNAYPTMPSTTTKMTLPSGPYTAVEGYLHLAEPILGPDQKGVTTAKTSAGSGSKL